MTEIPGINNYQASPILRTQSYSVPGSRTDSASRPAASRGDQVEISSVAQHLQKVASLPEIRTEKVQAIQAGLADGSYDIDARLDSALDRMLDEHLN